MKKLCIISLICLSYSYNSNAQTTSPDSPPLLPDTAFSIDQNKAGALYRSPNDSLKRPSGSIAPKDTALYSNQDKDSKTVKYKKQSAQRKSPANKNVRNSQRQNATTKKKGQIQ